VSPAEATNGLVEALRATCSVMGGDGDAPEPWCPACDRSIAFCESRQGRRSSGRAVCIGPAARRALSTWDTRGRLRDDLSLRNLLLGLMTGDGFHTIDEALDAIDTAVLGTPK
jgi:hypothetical protein